VLARARVHNLSLQINEIQILHLSYYIIVTCRRVNLFRYESACLVFSEKSQSVLVSPTVSAVGKELLLVNLELSANVRQLRRRRSSVSPCEIFIGAMKNCAELRERDKHVSLLKRARSILARFRIKCDE